MRFIATLLLIVLGIIYYPLNLLYMKMQKWYLPMWHKDRVIYFAFAPFYWILVAIVFIISYPYEWISKFAAH
ncbi:MAG TPA: hypothetical protein VMR49_03265 [Candidatus Paceibacterota bacterium]|nr:hypothetical protein [Candidatus Paceibacterota bacterium]